MQQWVLQYRPRQIMVYAGDNDLAEGRTPVQVLESCEGFVRAVRAELPGARIGYISDCIRTAYFENMHKKGFQPLLNKRWKLSFL